MTNSETQTKFTLNLPASTSVKSFTDEVASQLGYVPDTFTISYERNEDGELNEVIKSRSEFSEIQIFWIHVADIVDVSMTGSVSADVCMVINYQ